MNKTVRVGVLSDTHRDEVILGLAMERLQADGPLDALCFLGDSTADLVTVAECLYPYKKTPIYAVRGNNDFFSDLPDERTVSLGGKRVLLVHGHLQRVKMHHIGLLMCAQEAEADVALFGHTHRPECGYERGILLINPGAASGKHPTCASILLQDGAIHPEIHELC